MNIKKTSLLNASISDSIFLWSKLEKLITKILNGKNVSYADAENILLNLGFELKISSSHHNFRKPKYNRTITIKKRSQLLPYQVNDLKEVLKDHGY